MKNDNRFTLITVGTVLIAGALIVFIENTIVVSLLTALVILLGCFGTYMLSDDLSRMSGFSTGCTFLFGAVLLAIGSGVIKAQVNISGIIFTTVFAIFIPLIFSSAYALYRHDVERNSFSEFFTDQAISIGIVYIVFLVWWIVFYNVAYVVPGTEKQFIPFATFSAYLEGVIVKKISVSILLLYIAYTCLVYAPLGFYAAMLLERFHILFRIAVIVFTPLAVEILQLITNKNVCDIDDFLFGFVGGVVGMLMYSGLDALFLSVCGRGLKGKAKRYSFE